SYYEQIRKQPLIGERVEKMSGLLEAADDRQRVHLLAGLLRDARKLFTGENDLPADSQGRQALALLDLVNYAGNLLTHAANSWLSHQSERLAIREGSLGVEDAGHLGTGAGPMAMSELPSRADLLDFLIDLLHATYGSGFLFDREYEALIGAAVSTFHPASGIDFYDHANGRAGEPVSAEGGPNGAAGSPPPVAELTVAIYNDRIHYLGHAIDWAQAAVRQTLGLVLDRYRSVEPAASGVRDEVLRSSVLLPFASVIDLLSRDASLAIGLPHSVFDVELHTGLEGLNAGVTVGRLRVIDKLADVEDLDPTGIYVLPETPADLGRVAGILTLQEGSRLSHIQLLARSLGLPNAVISPSLLPKLREYEGERVFYAVSPLGIVVLKRADEMTQQDQTTLEESQGGNGRRFAIDLSRLDLSVRNVLELEDVDLTDSGRIVGPKAANLGRLHRLFPDHVAPGLVIPFGVFRQHIDRDLTGDGRTLYEKLISIYAEADEAAAAGTDSATIHSMLVSRLEEVRKTIVGMELLPDFVNELRAALRRRFGTDGSYGVFVRSDTNVEDLPYFTGAGLNLTLMNQIGTDEILAAIKKVWASPFSERSYTWRQRLLADPEDVYPSVILLRSVPVEASGVLATADVASGRPGFWTVTLAEGVGGVVEGEPAETVLLPASGGALVLLSSARAVWRKVLRMVGDGGVARVPVHGYSVLLTPERQRQLREVMAKILERYPPVLGKEGDPMPWDIEFGFVGDHLALFQIRPLVESRHTAMLRGLMAMDRAARARGVAPLSLDEPPRLP
ncbi:MAG: PEP/pyruvate-binding domain-containing protein, partial [Acidobacteriota bacterium]